MFNPLSINNSETIAQLIKPSNDRIGNSFVVTEFLEVLLSIGNIGLKAGKYNLILLRSV